MMSRERSWLRVKHLFQRRNRRLWRLWTSREERFVAIANPPAHGEAGGRPCDATIERTRVWRSRLTTLGRTSRTRIVALKLSITGVVAGAVGLLAQEACAQTATTAADDVLRRDLISQAEAARSSGNHELAYDLAARAAQLRASASLSMMLAQEASALGHVVDALDAARRCVADATADSTLRHRDRIRRVCADLVTELEPQIARLLLRVPADAPGVVVEVRQRAIPSAVWGVPFAVDVGEVAVRARTSDGRVFSETISITAGQRAELEIVFPSISPEHSRSPEVATNRSETEQPRTHSQDTAPPSSGIGAGPFLLLGLGAASLAGAGVLWMQHGSAISERDGVCNPSGCLPSAIDANESAQTLTTATNVSLAIGGAALIAGGTWLAIRLAQRGSSTHQDRPNHASLLMMPGLIGVSFGGTL